MARSSSDITALLVDIGDGDAAAQERLWEVAYPELRRLAHGALRRRPGASLQTTALVHEAYLKLVQNDDAGWSGRLHFYAVASKAMRHILIDHARHRSRQKRGGGQRPLPLDEALIAADEQAETFLALDEALRQLATLNERLVEVVECRFFGGMTIAGTAEALGVSPATVKRDWVLVQAWLHRELEGVR